MSAFTSRTSGYKAGVILLFFAGIAFIVGFGSPYWATAEVSGLTGNFNGIQLMTDYDEGLWMLCISLKSSILSQTSCGSYGLDGFPAWFHVVRVLECVGVAGVVVSCIYALATNCCRSVPGPRSRFLEATAALAGLLAFAGCMVYVGLRNDKSSDSTSGLSQYVIIFLGVSDWTFNWAFYLAAVGSGLVVIAAILIGVNNKPVEAAASYVGQPTVAMTTMHSQQTAVPMTSYAAPQPQPYVVQPQPVAKAGYPEFPNYQPGVVRY